MKKAPIEQDLFGSPLEDWVDSARNIQFKLGSIRNSYVGNKRKILPDLARILFEKDLQSKIIGGRVLDLFSGSAFVGYMFKKLGAAVWSNEILASSFLNSVCLVENDDCYVSVEEVQSLLKIVDGAFGPASKYVDIRFTKEEALVLDSFLINLKNRGLPVSNEIDILTQKNLQNKIKTYGMTNSKKLFAGNKFSYKICFSTMCLIHYVMNHCYVGGRLNSGQILAKLDHRLEHNRNQGYQMSFKDILPYNLAIDNGLSCIATRLDAIDLLETYKPEVDLIYIDPPYGGDQSDYGDMYSFFEEYLGFPQEVGSNRFIKSKNYNKSFEELLSKLPSSSAWVFSYNDDSWANLDTISSCIKQFNNRLVFPEEIDYEYKYRSKEKSSGKEYVIVSVP